MKSFPMFIRTTGRRVVIVGGGEEAAQKTRLMLKTDAAITLAAPDLEAELAGLVANGRARHDPAPLTPQTFAGAAMAFVATGCPGLDAAAHGLAQAARCPVNVVDRPELCDLTTPSIVDRDPVVVAIGTEGTAPVLGRQIKTQVERMLAPTLGGYAALAGRLRGAVARAVPREGRRAFWAWAFDGPARDAWERGAEREAASRLKDAMSRAPAPRTGSIAYVGAGPGALDLLTMRAVARLQEADVIFHDRLVDPGALELARRDAERVHVGKQVGAHDWPQERIDAAVVAEARKGRRVVRLKSGDPGIFGRLAEELAAARAAGIEVEIVPGVTAASAAAAEAGIPLTSRGQSDTLVLATGAARAGAPDPDCLRHAGPGTTTAFYMAAAKAGRISAGLMARGLPAEAEVVVGHRVSKPGGRSLRCTLADLPAALRRENVTGVATILVTWPAKTESAVIAAE
ncbi:siroheme synthase CysG [Roseivivax sediminis]|uniref:Uroporphyrin-III C-methyltransferase / precorrin-2 dehydrogenase / sirohydrochlorin ferrochelatase n=1 Tax=Roseivivax sediminis TaxID=936889 RepID=A0A1I1YWI5_9RHOB|nr:siroheme synthase CysG [Roseivivax sediminis]SFE22400.1 uroporphyrin-III C-methyltransferase / precorrin-2 dehydrogenase / sirohydrochlorin ferrochelatase [Roseivivax sediminis]